MALSMALAGCSGGSPAAPAPSGDTPGQMTPLKIRDGVFPAGLFVVDYVAASEGKFKENAIDVELVGPATTTATAFQLMAGGQLDLYGSDLMTVLTGLEQNLDVKVIACSASANEYVIISGGGALGQDLKSKPFKDRMKALEGKTIGVTGLSTGTDYALTLALRSAGVDPNSVTRVAVGPPSAALGQLDAGTIDAYVTGSLDGGALITNSVAKAFTYAMFSGKDAPAELRTFTSKVWFMPSKLANDPGIAKRVRDSLAAAADFIVADPSAAAKIMARDMVGDPNATFTKEPAQQMADTFLAPNPGLQCQPEMLTNANKSLNTLGVSDRKFTAEEVFAK